MRPLSILTTLGFCLLLSAHAAVSRAEQQNIDLSLAEAVQTALLKNLGLRLSQEDVVSAEGAALAAEGAFDYQLSGEVGAGEKDEEPVTAIEGNEERTAGFKAGVEKRFTP
ncbi:MAG: hypothetical protein EX260_08825, partial [Desulfobulbaceae bacterium]